MKLTAVILALSVISGCQGRFLLQDEPKTNWENMVDTFWEYVNGVSTTAEDMRKSIQSSQIGRELDTLITDSMAELQMYTDDVKSKLAPYTKEMAQKVHKDIQLLSNKLRVHMEEAKDRITDYAQELQTMVEQNTDEVKNRVNGYIRKLKKRLNKDTQEIKDKIETYLEEVQGRASQHTDDMNDRLTAYFDAVRQNAKDKFNTLKGLLNDQAEKAMEKWDNMKERAEEVKRILFTPLKKKMDKAKNWFQQFLNL